MASFSTVALATLRGMAELNKTFIVDDVWDQMPPVEVREKRKMGGVIRTAKERGWIVPTGTFRNSKQESCHGNPRPVWRFV